MKLTLRLILAFLLGATAGVIAAEPAGSDIVSACRL